MAGPAAGLVASSAITGGNQLLQGLLQSAAARRQQQRELAAQREQQGQNMAVSGIQDTANNQALAFQNLVSSFGRALGT